MIVKYARKENAQHLINAIKAEGYKVSIDWEGAKYCRITLDWNYELRTLTISMPGWLQKMFVRFKHEPPSRNQYSPYQSQPRKFGKDKDDTIPVDKSPNLDKNAKR